MQLIPLLNNFLYEHSALALTSDRGKAFVFLSACLVTVGGAEHARHQYYARIQQSAR